jgi:heme/copper-type cytochrome/quinol oxidase subunit 4
MKRKKKTSSATKTQTGTPPRLTLSLILLEIFTSVPLAVMAGVFAVAVLREILKLPMFLGISRNKTVENWILELVGVAIVVSLIIIFMNFWKRLLKRYRGIDPEK